MLSHFLMPRFPVVRTAFINRARNTSPAFRHCEVLFMLHGRLINHMGTSNLVVFILRPGWAFSAGGLCGTDIAYLQCQNHWWHLVLWVYKELLVLCGITESWLKCHSCYIVWMVLVCEIWFGVSGACSMSHDSDKPHVLAYLAGQMQSLAV